MDRRIAVFAVSALLLLSSFVCILNTDKNVNWQQLEESNPYAASVAESHAESDTVTIQDVLNFMLIDSGVPESQLGRYPVDWNMMSVSCGLTYGILKDLSAQATDGDLSVIRSNSGILRSTFECGVTEPLFVNGVAQPVFPYTYDRNGDYSNSDSQILRYCVYVETEYDTDNDGERDLVKVFVQVPRAAVEGGYKAPVILMCNPYNVGMNSESSIPSEDLYDLSLLDSSPDARVPAGEMTAMDAIYDADPSEWAKYGAEYNYDYFLVRGYAYAICSGLGTAGSEGFQMCGTETELRSYASVIGWFNGTVPAYTDPYNLVTTEATWCSGDVGTVGISYLGTISVGLAAMGVEGLRTVIPEGAIGDWYEYSCQQGAYYMAKYPYNSDLAYVCSSGREYCGDYEDYLKTLSYYESILEYHYSDGSNTFWEDRDYTRYGCDSDTSVLLIHGLNDYNVKTRQVWGNYKMFSDAGMEVRMILHQGDHHAQIRSIDSGKSYISMALCDTDACILYNEWLSYYLFGQNNCVKDMPDIAVQSNTDGSWAYFDDLDPSAVGYFVSDSYGTNTFSKEGYDSDPVFSTESDSGRTAWTVLTADSDLTISGSPVFTVKASASKDSGNLCMTVSLYDVCDDGFLAYDLLGNGMSLNMDVSGTSVKEGGCGVWSGSGLTDYDRYEFVMSEVTRCLVTNGAVNLCMPDAFDTRESWSVWTDTEAGEYYEYNIQLSPTVYTLKEGHSLVAVIYTIDADNLEYEEITAEEYEITVDLGSMTVEIPIL